MSYGGELEDDEGSLGGLIGVLICCGVGVLLAGLLMVRICFQTSGQCILR